MKIKNLFVYIIFCLTMPMVQAQDKVNRKYAGGLKLNRTRSLTVLTKAPLATRSFANLPAQVSYEAYCPSVGDQGRQETSVAFATAYYLRTIMEGKERNLTQKSQIDQSRFSPTYVYTKIRDSKDVGCKEGGTIEEALEVLKTDGVPRLRTLGYPACIQTVPANAVKEASQFKIGDYQQLFDETEIPEQKVMAVKKALSDGNPVVVGIGAPLSFEEVRTVWVPAPNEKIDDVLYNHAICVIGYDDKQHGGSFRIVNSWNTNWGERGFCWIPYSHFGKFTLNAFQIYSILHESTSLLANKTNSTGNQTSRSNDATEQEYKRRGKAELKLNDGSIMEVSRQTTRELKVTDDDSGPTNVRPYRVLKSYPDGTRFKFYLNNSESAYVYAITTNKSGDFEKLFPYDDLTSPLLGPNSTIVYPAENKSIVMEKHKGKDYLLLLFSKRPLNVDGLIKSLDRKKGALDKRVAEVLGNQLVRQDQIYYREDQLSFDVKGEAIGNIVPMLIELSYK